MLEGGVSKIYIGVPTYYHLSKFTIYCIDFPLWMGRCAMFLTLSVSLFSVVCICIHAFSPVIMMMTNDSTQEHLPACTPTACSRSISTSELLSLPMHTGIPIAKASNQKLSQVAVNNNPPPKVVVKPITVRPTKKRTKKPSAKPTVRISRTPLKKKASVKPISVSPSRKPSATPTAATEFSTEAPTTMDDPLMEVKPTAAVTLTVRKEIREMSSAELDRYFNALWEYKNRGRRDNRPYFRNYYALVAHHALATANSTVS